MDNLTIYSDLRISKQRRRHVIANDTNQIERWAETITKAFQICLDLGHTKVNVEDEFGRFEVEIIKIDTRD